ncbi:MAG: hypothetical protein HY809_09125 [Nitrospirae bacterium]|nr:hypothetical protein [Nitrospirota bacterium]
MDSLNIDLRDDCLRILRVKDGSVVSARYSSGFSLANRKNAAERLTTEIEEAGGPHGKFNVVIPQNMVQHAILQMPAVSDSDISAILKRKIAKEYTGEDFTFSFREIAEKGKVRRGSKNVLAEYVDGKDMAECLSFFKECGIRPNLITSGLEGNLYLFKRLRPATDGNEAVVDIGSGYIEILIVNNGRLIDYEKLNLLIDFSEKTPAEETSGGDPSKIKIYKIIDVIYNSITPYVKASGDEALSRVWLCGIGSTLEGISESVSSGFGISAALLNGLNSTQRNGSIFSSLSGISMLHPSEKITNLLPEKIITRTKNIINNAALAVLAAAYMIMLFFIYSSIRKTEMNLQSIFNKTSAEAQAPSESDGGIYSKKREAFFRIISESPSLYPILSDIANLTPPGVRIERLEFNKEKSTTKLFIDASMAHVSETYGKAVITNYLSSLESSKKIKSISIPKITAHGPSEKTNYISVKSVYEVAR